MNTSPQPDWADVVSWILAEVDPTTVNGCIERIRMDISDLRPPLVVEYLLPNDPAKPTGDDGQKVDDAHIIDAERNTVTDPGQARSKRFPTLPSDLTAHEPENRLGAICFRPLRCNRASLVGLRTVQGIPGYAVERIVQDMLMKVIDQVGDATRLTALYATCSESSEEYQTFLAAGFRQLATLHHLCLLQTQSTAKLRETRRTDQRELHVRTEQSQPWDLQWTERWSERLESLIRATFEHTLDLPSLAADYQASENDDLASQIGASNEYFGDLHVLIAKANERTDGDFDWDQHESAGWIGCLVLKVAGDLIDLCYLGVVPEYRRCGVARSLMREANRFLHERFGGNDSFTNESAVPPWTTNVDVENHPALRLYHEFGFRELSSFALLECRTQAPAFCAERGSVRSASTLQTRDLPMEPKHPKQDR